VSRLSRRRGSLDISQLYGPSRPVTGRVLPILLHLEACNLAPFFVLFIRAGAIAYSELELTQKLLGCIQRTTKCYCVTTQEKRKEMDTVQCFVRNFEFVMCGAVLEHFINVNEISEIFVCSRKVI
jgi:hypothetical protein